MKSTNQMGLVHFRAEHPALMDYWVDYWFTQRGILVVRLLPRLLSILLFPAAIIAMFVLANFVQFAIDVPNSFTLFGLLSFFISIIGGFALWFVGSKVASRARHVLAKIPAEKVVEIKSTMFIPWSEVTSGHFNRIHRGLAVTSHEGSLRTTIRSSDIDLAISLLKSNLGDKMIIS